MHFINKEQQNPKDLSSNPLENQQYLLYKYLLLFDDS
jgi:hypothetical protein